MPRRLLHSLAALLLATVAVLGFATPAGAAPGDSYVALGDSYSSGVGAGSYTDESGACDRSPNAYPALWAAANAPASYRSVACSGATTADVLSNQISALSTGTTLVSITIGGNDVGFADIMQTCVLYGTDDCVAAIEQAEAVAQANLAGWLAPTYAAIRAAAPNARVVVVSYPVFYQLGTSGCVGLSETSRTKINEGIGLVDDITASVAASYGFTFADVRGAFTGHQLCTDEDWLHALSFNIGQSYHPTAVGQANGYLPVFTSAAG